MEEGACAALYRAETSSHCVITEDQIIHDLYESRAHYAEFDDRTKKEGLKYP